ncbi:Hydrogenase maturation factor HypD [Neomoorella glycerini]|uniref:Hydrogenase maturation factor HypD n=1 Tax=Neomoorella glycerini TaxID=55779 RepID=A0A6I5ZMG9_9FIRM|nr:hydrogenase formation protein HypD [Moorella glycerini]QGP91084.1 Hydrogenase maturation factor HypD [Moorella glycerini]
METWSTNHQKELTARLLVRVKSLAAAIAGKLGRRPVIMEVCGTHTVALARTGLRSLLAGCIDLRSGPGCPVCVTAPEEIDYMLCLARQPGVIIATFGDMVRVPGSSGSLEKARIEGCQIQVCYSPREAVTLARSNPDREVVFLGIGFETTAPAVGLAVKEAAALSLKNFSIYSAHKLVPPALATLAADPDLKLDGLLLPGHVSAILGRRAFTFLAREYNLPAAIAGFDALDILGALLELLLQIQKGEAQVNNAYPRVVSETGNHKAQEILREVFSLAPANWRGLGLIPLSGLKLNTAYEAFDASHRWRLELKPAPPPAGCLCGSVLKGLCLPPQCALFGRRCTPLRPVGPCMVSSEGSCAAYYRYAREAG